MRWLKASFPDNDPQLADSVRALADAVGTVIDTKKLDRGGQVQELLAELRTLAAQACTGAAADSRG